MIMQKSSERSIAVTALVAAGLRGVCVNVYANPVAGEARVGLGATGTSSQPKPSLKEALPRLATKPPPPRSGRALPGVLYTIAPSLAQVRSPHRKALSALGPPPVVLSSVFQGPVTRELIQVGPV